jgi:hypothetical protein
VEVVGDGDGDVEGSNEADSLSNAQLSAFGRLVLPWSAPPFWTSLSRSRQTSDEHHQRALELLARVVAMLTKMRR